MAEREAPAAPTLDPLKRLEQVDRRDESTEEEGGSRREERRRRRVEPSDPAEPVRPAVAQLAEHAEWVRKPQRSWPRRILVTACVLLAALVIGVAIWVGATAEKLSPTVTAGQLAERMSGRLGEARYILGGVTTEGIGTDNGRYAFVRASNGSFRYRGLDERSDIAYDAGSGTAQSWRLRQDGTAEASEDTGLAPGPPDADGSSRYLRDDELGAIVRTLKASPATLARSRRQNGRDVWVVDVRLPTSSDARVDNVRLVIDQRRQLPVEISRSVDGVAIQRKRFTDLRLASEVRPGSFQVEFPVGRAAGASRQHVSSAASCLRCVDWSTIRPPHRDGCPEASSCRPRPCSPGARRDWERPQAGTTRRIETSCRSSTDGEWSNWR